MSTSPHRASGATASEAAFDLLTDDPAASSSTLVDDAVGASVNRPDPLFDQEAPFVEAPASARVDTFGPVVGDVDPDAEVDQAAYAEDSYELASHRPMPRATVYASLPGMPGRGVVLVTGLVTAFTAGLDFAMTGGLSYFFDLTFVVICLVAAMAVRGHDLFTTGVLPPLAFGVTIAVIAVLAPETFVGQGGISRVFLTGLTAHAGALVFGYGTALATVASRAAHHRHH